MQGYRVNHSITVTVAASAADSARSSLPIQRGQQDLTAAVVVVYERK